MSGRRLKTALAGLMLVGGLASLSVSGTYAIMNSQQSNHLGTAASGTLTFGDAVGTGTSCFSYGAGSSGNANPTCSPLMSATSLNYPGVPATANVTITNNGSIGIGDLSMYMPSCTKQDTSGAPSPGGANPCDAGGADLTIQETDSSGNPTFCWYPDGAAGACSWIDDTLSYVAQGVTDPTGALDLGAGPAPAQSRYFTIGLMLPTTATNALQGEGALFSVAWHVRT